LLYPLISLVATLSTTADGDPKNMWKKWGEMKEIESPP